LLLVAVPITDAAAAAAARLALPLLLHNKCYPAKLNYACLFE
jgi:hypothetical protein